MLAACGDGSVRSPDLPPVQLLGIGQVVCTYPNGGSSIAVGQTATCQVVGGCTFREVLADGSTHDFTGACPDLTYQSNNPGVGSIDPGTGVVTGVSPGQTGITASGGGATSAPTTVTVTAACAQSIAVTPAQATIISGPTAGTSQPYTARVTLDNGSTADVSGSATWSSNDTNAATFSGNIATAEPGLDAQTAVTVTATYSGSNVCNNGTLTDTADLTVRPAQLLASGALCIDTIPPAAAFSGCRTDTGACAATDTIALEVGQQRQLLIRARFDNGEECNITGISAIASADDGIATVDDAEMLNGVAVGDTTVSAAFDGQTASRSVQVTAAPVNQVLGKNSVVVHAKRPFSDTEEITIAEARVHKFACVGADNLVIDGLGGSGVKTGLKTYALAKTCDDADLDENGSCTAPGDGGNTVAAFEGLKLNHQDDGVTNLPPKGGAGSPVLDDRIKWTSVPGYWDGAKCVAQDAQRALVGDAYLNPRAVQIDPETGLPFQAAEKQPNGLVYSEALARIGLSCVTAEYENPEDADNRIVDGMTVLVLPATNDNLWSGSDAGYQLCETLQPLFIAPLLGLPTDDLLATLTDVVNTVLVQLDPLTTPVDQVVTTLVDTLGEQLTGDLITALDEALLDPVVEPVLCQLTSGVNGLLRALTGNPEPEQQCEEEPVDPAP